MKRHTITAIIGVLVLVFTALNLTFNMRSGSLSWPPIHDDATYLLDAYHRLAFGGVDSLATLIRTFYLDPPHAPMTTLTEILGFSLLGSSVYAAYAANAWLLAVFAVTTYLATCRSVDQIASIAIGD